MAAWYNVAPMLQRSTLAGNATFLQVLTNAFSYTSGCCGGEEGEGWGSGGRGGRDRS